MSSRRRDNPNTNSSSSADDDDDPPPNPSPPASHTPRGQLRARSKQYNSAPRHVSRRNSDSEPSSDEEDQVRPGRRPSMAKKSPKNISSKANPNSNSNANPPANNSAKHSNNSSSTSARTKRTSRKPKHLSDFDHEDGDHDEDSDPSLGTQDDVDEDEDIDADEDSDDAPDQEDVEMDDDEDEDEHVPRTPAPKIKSSRKSSSSKSRRPSSSSSRKSKSKSIKSSSSSKSKSKHKKSSTPSQSGRRNPARTTRGRNSLFENNDEDINDDLLLSEVEDDEPRRRQSELRDSTEDELIAPSMKSERLMEKILGRRLKSPRLENTNSNESNTKKPENAKAKQEDDKMDTTPDTGSSNKDPVADGSESDEKKKTQAEIDQTSSAKPDGDTTGATVEPVYEYLIKWKKLSHIHCEWVDEDVILAMPQGKSRLNRFLSKQDIRDMQRGTDINPEVDEDDLIPEDFVSVDRILSDRINSKEMLEYFVKWCSLPYAESTWEIAEDVKDDNKIEEFARRNQKPPAEMLIAPPRPEASEYRRLPMPKFRNNGELRDYQMEGFNWLVNCWFNRQGCILADEMGLGKTIQSVSFLNELFVGRKILGPFLVLAPLSTLGHWQREFQTWTEMNAIVYHGSTESRRIIAEYEWSYGTPQKGPPFKWHVMITTYETILQEANKLRHINWKAMVVDEAHRLKNRNSRLVDELVSFKSEHRVLLTGTPIQNNSMEVHALLHFLEPDKFMSEEEFAGQFGDIKDAATVDKLKALLRPYLLRRLKEDVEKSIPPKEETVISVELTRVQKKWYRAIYDNNFSFLDKGKKSNNVGNLRNIVMELRKCCNHPYLIKGVEEIEASALPSGADRAAHMSHLISASGKMVLVDKLLPQLKEQGSRVLVFSQMIRVLDILEDYLLDKRWGYERIDGRVRGNDRQQAIDRYSKPDSDKFVFLLCTRAGGQGINLTCADTVIIYDSDWNPQNDVQAQARCHRIGQKTKVKIYRLITRGTYEQNMFDRASKKLGLDQAILQNMGKTESVLSGAAAKSKNKNTSLLNDMNRTDIDSLLKKGAYDVFNEDDAAADAFTSEDIHQILTGRTRVLSSTPANAGPSEFSKASFKVEKDTDENKGDLALDDPDFWKKLMPEASKAPDPNIEVLPRRRRQTVRYQPKIGFDTSDDEEEDDDASGDEGPAKLGPNGKRLFNKGERHRLQRALCSMGWGRWHEILEYAGAPVTDRRNVDDVAQFCKALMRCCWEVAEKNLSEDPKFQSKIAEIKKRISDVLEDAYAPHRAIVGKVRKKYRANSKDDESEDESESEAEGVSTDDYGNLVGPVNPDPEYVNFTDPILTSAEYESYLSRNASSILERMELLGNIRNLYKDGSLNEGSEMPTVGASGSQAVEDWWDKTFDRDLLKGTFKHGYSNHEKLLKDPDLCFLGRVLPPQKDKRTNAAEKSNGRNESDSDGEGDKKNSKKADRTGTGSDSEEEGKTDDEKNSKDAEQPVLFVAEEEYKARKWPPVNVLNVRVRKLVRGFERMRKRAERVAKQEEDQEKSRRLKEEKRIAREKQQEEHAAEKSRKLAEANRHWSKKEKQDFCKYFSSTGAPPLDNNGKQSWALVKERAHLSKKEPAQLQAYAKEFKAMCDVMVTADEWIKKHKSSLAKFFDEMGPKTDGKKGGSAAGSEDHITKSKKSKKPTVPYTLQQMEDARVTIVNAKKFTERNTMITTLRREVLKELNNPATKALIEKKGAPGTRERLPDWWRENRQVVDVALLQGIATHGFDPAQTALDASLPFRNLLAQNVIDYITDTLSTHNSAPEFNPDSYVIPKNISEVADADILTFFPKDKMIIGRLQRLINVVTKQQKDEDEPATAPVEPTSAPRSRPSVGGSRKRNIGSVGNAPLGDGGNLVVMDRGILAGAIPSAFEAAPIERMTRKLLKFLKQQKKMNSNQILKLELPDWSPVESEFGRINADGSEFKENKRRRVNGTSTPGETGGGSRKESLAQSSSIGTANTNNIQKESKVMESLMHKVEFNGDGEIIFPIRLGVLTIESLGSIEYTRPGWHTERNIYPIGFKTVREYTSMVDINRTCQYVSEILDDGGPTPIFQVTCLDGEKETRRDSSSSACWTYIMSVIKDKTPEDRKRLHTTVSGPEYFGLSNALVQELLQDLENVDKLTKYKRKTFVNKSVAEKNSNNNIEDEINNESSKSDGEGAGEYDDDENEDEDEEMMEDVSDEDMEDEENNEGHSNSNSEIMHIDTPQDNNNMEADEAADTAALEAGIEAAD